MFEPYLTKCVITLTVECNNTLLAIFICHLWNIYSKCMTRIWTSLFGYSWLYIVYIVVAGFRLKPLNFCDRFKSGQKWLENFKFVSLNPWRRTLYIKFINFDRLFRKPYFFITAVKQFRIRSNSLASFPIAC